MSVLGTTEHSSCNQCIDIWQYSCIVLYCSRSPCVSIIFHIIINEHWNRFKVNVGETSERRVGAHMGFPERIDTIFNGTELIIISNIIIKLSLSSCFVSDFKIVIIVAVFMTVIVIVITVVLFIAYRHAC